MRKVGFLFLGLIVAAAHAATSSFLVSSYNIWNGAPALAGAPGNVVFNGDHFVTPVVQGNGAIQLAFVGTNGAVLSNLTVSLSVTGSCPRLLVGGADYLFVWLNTNQTPNMLLAARIVAGAVGAVSALDIDVAEESIGLSRAGDKVLAVWQSAGPSSAVFGREIDLTGTPLGPIFAVAPSAQSQRYPSVDNDGTNHLVCWMQQNATNTDWHVLAKLVPAGMSKLNGSPVPVSETNSMQPYRTACSFGTNFLVAWSADAGDSNINYFVFPFVTNWHQSVHIRMMSLNAVPLGGERTVLCIPQNSTNVAVAFGGGQYVVACSTTSLRQYVQTVLADGTVVRALYSAAFGFTTNCIPRLAFGAGRFVALYPDYRLGAAQAVTLGYESMSNSLITNVRRTNDTIALQISAQPFPVIEISTNLTDWSRPGAGGLSAWGGQPRLFVRLVNHKWNCLANMRAIDWAKQHWAFDKWMFASNTPQDIDLFGPGGYLEQKPVCPQNGQYTFGDVASRTMCNVAGHDDTPPPPPGTFP